MQISNKISSVNLTYIVFLLKDNILLMLTKTYKLSCSE